MCAHYAAISDTVSIISKAVRALLHLSIFFALVLQPPSFRNLDPGPHSEHPSSLNASVGGVLFIATRVQHFFPTSRLPSTYIRTHAILGASCKPTFAHQKPPPGGSRARKIGLITRLDHRGRRHTETS